MKQKKLRFGFKKEIYVTSKNEHAIVFFLVNKH